MFRNRGRRVIAGSRGNSVPNNNNGVIPSTSTSPSPSPPKKYQHCRNYSHDPPPMMPSVNNNSRNTHFDDEQHHLQAQSNFRTRYEHSTSSSSSQPQMNTRSKLLSEEFVQSEFTTHQSQENQSLLSTKEEITKPRDNFVDIDDSKHSPFTITKQEELEQDHPPQSLPNSGGFITRRDDKRNAQMIESGNIYYQNYKSHENDDKELDKSNIMINHSHDSNDSENARSTVGSTVSIMGSITGEGDYSSNYDETKLLAMKRRMMQDVEEVSEDEDDYVNENSSKNYTTHENEETANIDTIHDDTLNISLECNADTDTSLLEDYPNNDDGMEQDEAIKNEDIHRNASNVVKVADFSNSNNIDVSSKNTINNINSTNNNEPTTKKEQESPFRAAFRRSAQGMSNHLPPLSSQMLGAAPSESLKRLTPNRFHRATASSAIDKAATTASLLPQLARQCFSFEDTTVDDDDFLAIPDHFYLGGEGGHSTTHKYYGLSAVASYATSDNDDSSTVKNSAQTKGTQSTDIETSTHASHLSLKRNAPRWHPPHRTRLSYGEPDSPFRTIGHSQTWNHHGQSPMRELMKPQYLPGSLRQTSSFDPWSPPSVGRRSSQRSWKEQEVQLLSSNGDGDVKPFPIDGSRGLDSRAAEQVGVNTNWKKIETERGDAIELLACMVKQTLNFDEMESKVSHEFLCEICRETPDSSCEDCLEKVKLIANSIKEISTDSSDDEQSPVFNRQITSDVVDTLLRSYEFALEAKQSSLSANKWLASIGCAENKNIVSDEIDGCNESLNGVATRARLHSAEYTISSKQGEISRLNEELSNCRAEIGRLKSSSRSQPQHHPITMSTNKSILSNSSSDESIDFLVTEGGGPLVLCSPRPTVKLSESHDESFLKWEKNIERQMNLESRKEVLLLRAALERANRKISALEEEPFSSEIEPIKAVSDDGTEQLFMRIAEDIENEALDVPVSDEGDARTNEDISAIPVAIKLDDPALEKELEEYRLALIMTLDPDGDGRRARADSISSSEDPNLAQDLSKSTSSVTSDRKMINVRMIDGENFSTEWGDLVDLPPPPDHALHSPIVETILSKWSDDPGTRSALIGWIENILNGSNTDSMPSLKIAGLDHQIRDGFLMHVLPLLLRRKDVHVHLTSRAHRQTTYDIAVTVRPTSFDVRNNEYDGVSDGGSGDPELQQRQVSRGIKHHLMAFQATKSGASIKENDDSYMSPNKQVKPFLGRSIPDLVRSASNAGSISTAVTSPISNRTPSRRPQIHGRNKYTSLSSEMKKGDNFLSHDEYAMPNLMTDASPSLGDDLSVGSSVEDDTDSKHSQRQSSIMGSISGAFGLLARRKLSPVDNEFQSGTPDINGGHSHSSMFQTPKRAASQSTSKSSNEEEHPYHRVVSAPPGKIGITFVEYRGHAMVSNVSEESPLVGWVFPSDVLVAIDDVPVSGLPLVRIVKLLTNRVGQQRNLRMVSAVAMNELTRPGTV